MHNNFLSASLHVAEMLRYNNMTNTNKHTIRLYSMITNNTPLLNLIDNSIKNIDLSSEMRYFVTNRLCFFGSFVMNTIVDVFKKNDFVNFDNSSVFKFNNKIYSQTTILNMRDYQKLEFDIDQTLNILSNNCMDNINIDLMNMMVFLYNAFLFEVKKYLLNEKTSPRLSYIDINQNYENNQCITIILFMFIKIANFIYQMNCSKINSDKDFIILNYKGNDKLHGYGYLSLLNIFCCFNNLKFIKDIVEDPNGYINADVQTFLSNIRYLSFYYSNVK